MLSTVTSTTGSGAVCVPSAYGSNSAHSLAQRRWHSDVSAHLLKYSFGCGTITKTCGSCRFRHSPASDFQPISR